MAVTVRPTVRETVGEVPTGAVNGFNATFTVATSFRFGSTRLYLNGVRQKLGAGNDYVENGTANSVTFAVAPRPGDFVIIDYFR